MSTIDFVRMWGTCYLFFVDVENLLHLFQDEKIPHIFFLNVGMQLHIFPDYGNPVREASWQERFADPGYRESESRASFARDNENAPKAWGVYIICEKER